MVRLIVIAVVAIGIFSALPHLASKFMQGDGSANSDPKAYSLKQGHRDTSATKRSSSPGRFKLEANRQGHFLTRAKLNGKSIRVLVDTGASSVVLTYEDARKIGLNPHPADFTIRTQTANGEGRAAKAKLRSVELGTIRENNIEAIIAPKGSLSVTLLGMTFLKELKRFELSGNQLVLEN